MTTQNDCGADYRRNNVLFQFGNRDLLKLVLELKALLGRYDKLQAYLHAKLLKMQILIF